MLIAVKVQLLILAIRIRQWWVSEEKPVILEFCKLIDSLKELNRSILINSDRKWLIFRKNTWIFKLKSERAHAF